MVMRPVQVFAFLLLLSSLAWAGRVGIVADTGTGSPMTSCVSYTGSKTAEDILKSSGLGVEFYYGWGPAFICKIGGTGVCPPSGSLSWAFYYSDGSSWVMSGTGVGFHDVTDGEVLGFSWTGYDENWMPINEPEWREFSKICPPDSSTSAPRLIKHFSVNITGNSSAAFCLGDSVKMEALSVEDRGPIWGDATFNEEKREVFLGAFVKIFHKDGWWSVAESGYTDKKGTYSFTPPKLGNYSIEITKSGYVHAYSDLEVKDCNAPQCTCDDDCGYDGVCNGGKCEPVCGSCGYVVDHKFIEYSCCSDSACGSGSRCEDHLCVKEDNAHVAEVMRVLFSIYYIN